MYWNLFVNSIKFYTLITNLLTMKTPSGFPGIDLAEKSLFSKYEIAGIKFVKNIEKVIRKSEKMTDPKHLKTDHP